MRSISPLQLYLDLLKNCLTRYIFIDEQPPIPGYSSDELKKLRYGGGCWPPTAETMIGLARLNNIEFCIKSIIDEGIPGDFIETGVWRGGAVILMRGILKAYGIIDRTVWVADSFQGLPKPDANYPPDAGNTLWAAKELAVGLDQVEQNFNKYDLLDDQVKFLPGWFKDTLPTAPITQLALLRLDGDLYESTMESLVHLYPKVAPGGYVIVDDWGLAPCRQAVEGYRSVFNISDEIKLVEGTATGLETAFWRKID